MSSVMIRCPVTGRAVSTAIETEPSVFRKLPKITAHMRCPACRQDHEWTMSSAWLAGEPPAGGTATAIEDRGGQG